MKSKSTIKKDFFDFIERTIICKTCDRIFTDVECCGDYDNSEMIEYINKCGNEEFLIILDIFIDYCQTIPTKPLPCGILDYIFEQLVTSPIYYLKKFDGWDKSDNPLKRLVYWLTQRPENSVKDYLFSVFINDPQTFDLIKHYPLLNDKILPSEELVLDMLNRLASSELISPVLTRIIFQDSNYKPLKLDVISKMLALYWKQPSNYHENLLMFIDDSLTSMFRIKEDVLPSSNRQWHEYREIILWVFANHSKNGVFQYINDYHLHFGKDFLDLMFIFLRENIDNITVIKTKDDINNSNTCDGIIHYCYCNYIVLPRDLYQKVQNYIEISIFKLGSKNNLLIGFYKSEDVITESDKFNNFALQLLYAISEKITRDELSADTIAKCTQIKNEVPNHNLFFCGIILNWGTSDEIKKVLDNVSSFNFFQTPIDDLNTLELFFKILHHKVYPLKLFKQLVKILQRMTPSHKVFIQLFLDHSRHVAKLIESCSIQGKNSLYQMGNIFSIPSIALKIISHSEIVHDLLIRNLKRGSYPTDIFRNIYDYLIGKGEDLKSTLATYLGQCSPLPKDPNVIYLISQLDNLDHSIIENFSSVTLHEQLFADFDQLDTKNRELAEKSLKYLSDSFLDQNNYSDDYDSDNEEELEEDNPHDISLLPLDQIYNSTRISTRDDFENLSSFIYTKWNLVSKSPTFINFFSNLPIYKIYVDNSFKMQRLIETLNSSSNNRNVPLQLQFPFNNLPMTLREKIIHHLLRDQLLSSYDKVNLAKVSQSFFKITSDILNHHYHQGSDLVLENQNYIEILNIDKVNFKHPFCLWKEFPKLETYHKLISYHDIDGALHDRLEHLRLTIDDEFNYNNVRILPDRNTKIQVIEMNILKKNINVDSYVEIFKKSPLLKTIYLATERHLTSVQTVLKNILLLQLPKLTDIHIDVMEDCDNEDDEDEDEEYDSDNDDDGDHHHGTKRPNISTIWMNMDDLKKTIKSEGGSNMKFPKLHLICPFKFSSLGFDSIYIIMTGKKLDRDIVPLYFNTLLTTRHVTISIEDLQLSLDVIPLISRFPTINSLSIRIHCIPTHLNPIEISLVQKLFDLLNCSNNIEYFSVNISPYISTIPLPLFYDMNTHDSNWSKISTGKFTSTNYPIMNFKRYVITQK
ncbi:hypothetical protein DLAC_09069 [Tieghemostelium lacteum]|uniref:F-box domain-containing protein n=1 Tax=Tieghemostelium lacteum TaxID=361077 RepID=A0A151Z927_TIELA|nr:hypothetical protein DLAC_09069 [Tieghemostelium lacteum]|eukprot:KYQ90447.1 hypothetical protein DLAC_09069 [Tieghemostelium lacteum]